MRIYAAKAAVCGRKKKEDGDWLSSLGPDRRRVAPYFAAIDIALDAHEKENPRPSRQPLTGNREVDARRFVDEVSRMGARACELMIQSARTVREKALAAIRRGDEALLNPSLRALASVQHLLEDESSTAKRFAEETLEEVTRKSKRPKNRAQRRS